MAIKIRVKGSGKASGQKASSSKSTAKKGSTKKTRGASKGRTTTTRKNAAKKQTAAPRTGPTPLQKERQALIKQHAKALETAGKNVVSTREAHEAAVDELYEVAQGALEANVPMTTVSALTGVSRQWLYKMGEHRSRNGSGPAKKASSKRSSSKKASSGAKRTRTTAKKTSSKKRSVKIARKR